MVGTTIYFLNKTCFKEEEWILHTADRDFQIWILTTRMARRGGWVSLDFGMWWMCVWISASSPEVVWLLASYLTSMQKCPKWAGGGWKQLESVIFLTLFWIARACWQSKVLYFPIKSSPAYNAPPHFLHPECSTSLPHPLVSHCCCQLIFSHL